MKLFSAREGLALGALLSLAAHAGAGAGLYWRLSRAEPPTVAELDLSMATLVPRAANPGGKGGAPRAEAWRTGPRGKTTVPLMPPVALAAPVPEEGPTCDGPCPEAAGTGTGDGTGVGEYVPAAQTARKPRWIGNMITEADYPVAARRAGKDGRVVLSLWIGADGRVREARLLKGSDLALNEAALKKAREALFAPARDAAGRPVACKVTIPIDFRLAR